MKLKTTLDQWLTLQSIEQAGSIQAAAHKLHKSHTTLLYTIRKLEQQVDVALVRTEGRRAVLTEEGQILLRRAGPVLEQAIGLEEMGSLMAQGMESEIKVSIDHLCDRNWLYQPLAEFLQQNTGTSVHVIETSLSSTRSVVTQRQVDIAIVTLPVTDFQAEAFGSVMMKAVVARDHPLAEKGLVCAEDLIAQTQIVIRDLNIGEQENAGWLRSQRRLTVDNFDHAITAVGAGAGFCRIPDYRLRQPELSDLVILPVEGSLQYQVPLHLVLPCQSCTGPAAKQLYRLLTDSAAERMTITG